MYLISPHPAGNRTSSTGNKYVLEWCVKSRQMVDHVCMHRPEGVWWGVGISACFFFNHEVGLITHRTLLTPGVPNCD